MSLNVMSPPPSFRKTGLVWGEIYAYKGYNNESEGNSTHIPWNIPSLRWVVALRVLTNVRCAAADEVTGRTYLAETLIQLRVQFWVDVKLSESSSSNELTLRRKDTGVSLCCAACPRQLSVSVHHRKAEHMVVTRRKKCLMIMWLTIASNFWSSLTRSGSWDHSWGLVGIPEEWSIGKLTSKKEGTQSMKLLLVLIAPVYTVSGEDTVGGLLGAKFEMMTPVIVCIFQG